MSLLSVEIAKNCFVRKNILTTNLDEVYLLSEMPISALVSLFPCSFVVSLSLSLYAHYLSVCLTILSFFFFIYISLVYTIMYKTFSTTLRFPPLPWSLRFTNKTHLHHSFLQSPFSSQELLSEANFTYNVRI